MASRTQDTRVVNSVPYPRCHAGIGERCRNPWAHQQGRGPEDRRAQPERPHAERRQAWEEWKRQQALG